MSLHRVVYRVGHKGRPSKPFDVGAARGSLNEVNCNEIVVQAASRAARTHQRFAAFESHHTEYLECQNWAVRNGADVYLALHLNAHADKSVSGGKFFYHPETASGDRLAEILAERTAAWGRKWLKRDYKTQAIRSSPNDWTKNAYYCIKKFGRSVKGVAVCGEPLFISNPTDRRKLCRPQPLAELGEVYDASIQQWLQERRLIA